MVPRVVRKVLASLPCRNTGKRSANPRASADDVLHVDPMDVRNPKQRDAGCSAGANDTLRMDPADVSKTEQPISSAGADDVLHMDSADVRNTEQRNPGSSAGADDMLRMDPKTVRDHFDRIGRFRILVIGRSNAGKTTVLQRVCNTTELPEVFNAEGEKIDPVVVQGSLERGYHDIENELIFRSSPGFVFHDSRGFESGSESELEMMKKFIADRATKMQLAERIHAVWFCIPMDESHRAFVTPEEQFFNECNTGHVPVIVLLTKADAMEGMAIGRLRDEGMQMKDAMEMAGDLGKQILSEVSTKIKIQLNGCKYPPKDYLSLHSMDREGADCDPLIRCTTSALDGVELQKLVISAQQINFDLNIEFAIGHIIDVAKGETFHKDLLEGGILAWMPMFPLFWQLRLKQDRQLQDRLKWWWQWKLKKWLLQDLLQWQQQWRKQDQALMQILDINTSFQVPLMFPGSIVSSMQKCIIHGVGCLIVYEYSYFHLQAKGNPQDVIAFAVKKYKDSGTQANVFHSLQQVLQQHDCASITLQKLIFDIILRNRMSNRFK